VEVKNKQEKYWSLQPTPYPYLVSAMDQYYGVSNPYKKDTTINRKKESSKEKQDRKKEPSNEKQNRKKEPSNEKQEKKKNPQRKNKTKR
jgi:hypothetical protein